MNFDHRQQKKNYKNHSFFINKLLLYFAIRKN